MTTINNPYSPGMFFSTYDGSAYILILRNDIRGDNGEFIRFLEPFEITDLCKTVKNRLGLKELGWGYKNNQCILWCAVEDVPKLYDIVNVLIKLNHTLFFNDKTPFVISKADYPFDSVKHERTLLKFLKEEPKNEIYVMRTVGFDVNNPDFWSIKEGKEFAGK